MPYMSNCSTFCVKRNVEKISPGFVEPPDNNMMSGSVALGRRLKELRKQVGEQQVDVAVAVGIERPSYTGIETGKAMPGRATLVALADHFGVSVDTLIGGAPMPTPAAREVIQDPDEIALVRFWRGLLPDQRPLVLRLMRPATGELDDVA